MSIVSDSRDKTSKLVYVERGTGKVTVYKWFTDTTIIDSLWVLVSGFSGFSSSKHSFV